MAGQFGDAFWRWISKMDLKRVDEVRYELDSYYKQRLAKEGTLGEFKRGDRVTLALTGTLDTDGRDWTIVSDHNGNPWYVDKDELPLIKRGRK